ncbi:hypothetical protein, variant [Saprolegnia diclina VS20]|uniref:Uncharacterized protein n=1 Tax=Saprolegnia diclina (strain VS20) TaxID=1156394 RepID=T0PHB4_SAPDV|nr:hypothetical protein, variant [Saprolegnia diclina VS20]EQC24754.1 hypothetical protein, variant [Saprolegnia diclina VS20]|eukprot:XP_008621818.1 hypothetical protein, variant [Saprolegnia diclina VS20]
MSFNIEARRATLRLELAQGPDAGDNSTPPMSPPRRARAPVLPAIEPRSKRAKKHNKMYKLLHELATRLQHYGVAFFRNLDATGEVDFECLGRVRELIPDELWEHFNGMTRPSRPRKTKGADRSTRQGSSQRGGHDGDRLGEEGDEEANIEVIVLVAQAAMIHNQKANFVHKIVTLFNYLKGSSEFQLNSLSKLGLGTTKQTVHGTCKLLLKSRDGNIKMEGFVVFGVDDLTRFLHFERIRPNGSTYCAIKLVVCVINAVPLSSPVPRDLSKPPNPPTFCSVECLTVAGLFDDSVAKIGHFLPWYTARYPSKGPRNDRYGFELYQYTDANERWHSDYLSGLRLLRINESDFKSIRHALLQFRSCLAVEAFDAYLNDNIMMLPGDYWAQYTFKKLIMICRLPEIERREVLATWMPEDEFPTETEIARLENVVPINGLLHISLTLLEAVCQTFDPLIRYLWPQIAPNQKLRQTLSHAEMIVCAEVLLGGYALLRDDLGRHRRRCKTAALDYLVHFFEHLLPLAVVFYEKFVRSECHLDLLQAIMPHVALAFVFLNRTHYKISTLEWISQIEHIRKSNVLLFNAMQNHTRWLLDEYMVEHQNGVIARNTKHATTVHEFIRSGYLGDVLGETTAAIMAKVQGNPRARTTRTDLTPLQNNAALAIIKVFEAARDPKQLTASVRWNSKKERWVCEAIYAQFLEGADIKLKSMPAVYHLLEKSGTGKLYMVMPCEDAAAAAVAAAAAAAFPTAAAGAPASPAGAPAAAPAPAAAATTAAAPAPAPSATTTTAATASLAASKTTRSKRRRLAPSKKSQMDTTLLEFTRYRVPDQDFVFEFVQTIVEALVDKSGDAYTAPKKQAIVCPDEPRVPTEPARNEPQAPMPCLESSRIALEEALRKVRSFSHL